MQKPFTNRNVIYLLFFFSGAVGLVYEVLWLKELQLLFGNTAYATATSLSVFFLGLSAGGWYWGKRSPLLSNLLRAYGFLEIGIGLTALLYFLLLGVYRSLYSPLFEIFETHAALFVFAKFLLSLTILFLPAFFMGGTLPVLSQYFIRRPLEMGKTGSLLYLALAFLMAILAGTGMKRHMAWAVGGLALFLHFSTQGDRSRRPLTLEADTLDPSLSSFKPQGTCPW